MEPARLRYRRARDSARWCTLILRRQTSMPPVLRHALTTLTLVLGVACASRGRVTELPNGLRYRVLATGRGAEAVSGQRVSIHETTTLPNGTLIYSSRGGNPITFQLGAGQVITGVDQGVTGMRVGERRLLIVPPALSRRTSYPANTPPDSVLHIDVELMQIRP